MRLIKKNKMLSRYAWDALHVLMKKGWEFSFYSYTVKKTKERHYAVCLTNNITKNKNNNSFWENATTLEKAFTLTISKVKAQNKIS